MLKQQQMGVPPDIFLMIDLVPFLRRGQWFFTSEPEKAWEEHMLLSQNLIFPKL